MMFVKYLGLVSIVIIFEFRSVSIPFEYDTVFEVASSLDCTKRKQTDDHEQKNVPCTRKRTKRGKTIQTDVNMKCHAVQDARPYVQLTAKMNTSDASSSRFESTMKTYVDTCQCRKSCIG
jgi:hypothetical protein